MDDLSANAIFKKVIGYANQGLSDDMLVSIKPEIVEFDNQ